METLAGLGPFFAVDTHGDGAPPPPWRVMSELVDDPAVLRDRVDAVRAHLAGAGGRVVPRVAASVAQLGLVARLVSPTMALALDGGRLPSPDLTDTWWQPEPGGAFPLSLALSRPPGGPAVDAVAAVLDGPVRLLVEAARAFSVPTGVLWGNVASAVNGAAVVLTRARPDLADAADDLVAELLTSEPLRDTGIRRRGDFRRRSCCLIYQAAPRDAPRQVCGDCVLAEP